MSTQSFIGVLCKEGIIKFVYCHSDGYPSYLGRMLLTHYNTPELATALVDLGSLSMVRERLAPDEGETHTFDTPVRHGPKGGVTTAYHRDRGEDLEIDSVVVDTPVVLKNAETLFLNIVFSLSVVQTLRVRLSAMCGTQMKTNLFGMSFLQLLPRVAVPTSPTPKPLFRNGSTMIAPTCIVTPRTRKTCL